MSDDALEILSRLIAVHDCRGAAEMRGVLSRARTELATARQDAERARAIAFEEACTVVAMFFEGECRPGTTSGELIHRLRALATPTPGPVPGRGCRHRGRQLGDGEWCAPCGIRSLTSPADTKGRPNGK